MGMLYNHPRTRRFDGVRLQLGVVFDRFSRFGVPVNVRFAVIATKIFAVQRSVAPSRRSKSSKSMSMKAAKPSSAPSRRGVVRQNPKDQAHGQVTHAPEREMRSPFEAEREA